MRQLIVYVMMLNVATLNHGFIGFEIVLTTKKISTVTHYFYWFFNDDFHKPALYYWLPFPMISDSFF